MPRTVGWELRKTTSRMSYQCITNGIMTGGADFGFSFLAHRSERK